jgi:hypothetical protein
LLLGSYGDAGSSIENRYEVEEPSGFDHLGDALLAAAPGPSPLAPAACSLVDE